MYPISSAPITKYYISSGTVSHLWTVPLLSKCVLTSYSVPLIFIRKLFPCSVHNSFMLHLIVPVRAAAEISDNVHRP